MRLIALILCFIPFASHAIKISGLVTDTDQKPLPFATLYIEGTTIGTTTNSAGIYSLDIPEGDHVIIFQYVGYKTLNDKFLRNQVILH